MLLPGPARRDPCIYRIKETDMRRRTWLRRLVAVSTLGFATSLFFSVPLSAQTPTGVVEGRVLESGSNRPLVGASVLIAGTTLGASTSDGGVYRINGVPARQVQLRVRLIGYAPGSRTIVVTAGQTTTADFSLPVSPLQLEQLVVTGSGQA